MTLNTRPLLLALSLAKTLDDGLVVVVVKQILVGDFGVVGGEKGIIHI